MDAAELTRTLKSTFARRETEIPNTRPLGLSAEFANDPAKITQWTAYAESTELEGVSLRDVVDDIWQWIGPICEAATAK